MRISAAWVVAFVIGFISLVLAATTDMFPFVLRIAVPFGSLYLAYQFTDKQRHATTTPGPAEPNAAPNPTYSTGNEPTA